MSLPLSVIRPVSTVVIFDSLVTSWPSCCCPRRCGLKRSRLWRLHSSRCQRFAVEFLHQHGAVRLTKTPDVFPTDAPSCEKRTPLHYQFPCLSRGRCLSTQPKQAPRLITRPFRENRVVYTATRVERRDQHVTGPRVDGFVYFILLNNSSGSTGIFKAFGSILSNNAFDLPKQPGALRPRKRNQGFHPPGLLMHYHYNMRHHPIYRLL